MARQLPSTLNRIQPALSTALVNSSVIGALGSLQMSQFYHSVFTSGWINMNVLIVLDCQFCGSNLKACRINYYLTWGNGKGKMAMFYVLLPLVHISIKPLQPKAVGIPSIMITFVVEGLDLAKTLACVGGNFSPHRSRE